MKPETRYTKSGRINIAYQVFGSGKKDLVYIPGWISNIDLIWDCPPLVSFFEQLSKVVRVILFDKRGTGLSDRVSDISTLEERMDDIRAVMDAVGSEQAILFGHSEGGSVSALFSATYPQRTSGLITFGVFAKRRWSDSYPWAPTDDERQKVYDMIDQHWGSGEMNLVSLAPSRANDKQFMDWLARYFRSGASPNAALALTKMNTQIDIIGILDFISVPTLLMYRTDDIDVRIEEGRFIADRIKGSKFVEFEGEDHLFWAGNYEEVLEQMVHFIEYDCDDKDYSTVLSTILKLRVKSIIDNGKNHQNQLPYDVAIKDLVHQYLGNVIEETDEGITATFTGPSKAVHCALHMEEVSHLYNRVVVQGLHIGEVRILQGIASPTLTMNIVDKIIDQAEDGDILITNTISSLLSGAGLSFTPFGLLSVGPSQKLQILAIKESKYIHQIEGESMELHFAQHSSKSHYFLEDVMQNIEANLIDENYSIHQLSLDIGVSIRQLQRKIKAITNKSPNNLIKSVRLHKAKELIIQEKKSVKEAAYATGFSSLSYFSRCFKIEFGITPSMIN